MVKSTNTGADRSGSNPRTITRYVCDLREVT